LKKILIFIFFIISNTSFSQTIVTRSANASVTVYSYIAMDLSTNGFLDFKFNNNQELLDGIILNNKFNIGVNSNKNWLLNVSTLTQSFISIGPDASTQMPSSILSLRKTTSNTFVPLSNSPKMVTQGSRGNDTQSGNNFKLDIKATPGYDYNGGAYAIVLLFTLTAQ
jgi:hypothetical protein